ncbi:hypothetical protein [Nocardia brasiliensis]|uniref:Transmembrane protein n=1 Tax=Nocardia brasiliensis (strain ATCC 700358 / HUJEG-1) TaxID=1133849 RepID=K0F8J2_NOCB7|nr:hypothetical protein [Nocardia brasiliensis]AFU06054.1 hypothetical protein O3I_040545 [Nocardia brasiliensis ATCC 700358]OCF88737.1 hypothetical protein AW168_20755 [Nocardia brasiliensis]
MDMQPNYPGSPYPPQPQAAPRVTPSGWWFALGALLIALGVLGGAALAVGSFTQVSGRVDDFQRIEVPGSGAVQLSETGGYTVYFEYSGASEAIFGGEVNVRIADPGGAPVQLRRYDSDVTYSFGKREGRAALSFDAAVPGTYQVTIQGDPGTSATAAIGRGLGTSFVGTLLGGIALGVGGLLLGLAVVIVVAVKRSGSKRRAAASGFTGGYPSGPPLPGPYQY